MKRTCFTVILILIGHAAWSQSTINPAVPTQNAPLSSAPIRNNFAAAYSDINRLFNPAANGVIAAGANVMFTGTNPIIISSSGGSGGGSPGGVSGQVQYNNAGSFGGFTLSGDASLNTATGVMSVSKTLGNPFAASATTDTTNATNILSGTLPIGRLSGSYTGITGVGTLTIGTTGVGFTVDLGNSTVTGTLGTSHGGTGQTTFTANLPLIGNGAGGIGQGTRSGNTTTYVTSSGSLINGHCVQIDGNSNYVDAGGPCTTGGGGGTVSMGNAGQLAYYATTDTTVTGNVNANINAGLLSLGQASMVSGQIRLFGDGSGSLSILPQSVAGTPVWTAGTSSGTPAVTASAPLAIATATGNLTLTGAAGQVLAGATPAFTATPGLGTNGSVTGTLGLANGGGSGATVTLQNLGATSAYNYNLPTTAGAIGAIDLSGGGTTNPNTWLVDVAAGSVLISGGVGAAPSYSTTIPAATQANITQLGTITSGLWNGTAITGTFIDTNTLANTNLAQMPADTVKCNNTGSTANAADCTNLIIAGATLNPTAATLNQGLVINQTPAGTVAGSFSASKIAMTNDVAAITGANFGIALNVNDVLNGSAAQGGREAIQGYMQLAAATSASNGNRNYIGIQGVGTATSGDGGTNTGAGALGAIFGSSAWGDLQSGATNMVNVTGAEFDVSVRTGASAKYKTGIQITDHGLDAVAGVSVDAGLALTGSSGAIGLTNGVLFTNMSGQQMVKSSGTLIAASGGTFAGGIDFSASTLTTFLKGPGSFSVDGSANVIAANASFNGQFRSTFGTPTIASGACGTGTNGTISGVNQAGSVTIGAAATATCTIGFSTTLANAPNACLIFPANATAGAQGTTIARVSSISATGFVITGSVLANTKYWYWCV